MKCENTWCGAYKGGICKLTPIGCCGYMPPEDVNKEYLAKWEKSIGFDKSSKCWTNNDGESK